MLRQNKFLFNSSIPNTKPVAINYKHDDFNRFGKHVGPRKISMNLEELVKIFCIFCGFALFPKTHKRHLQTETHLIKTEKELISLNVKEIMVTTNNTNAQWKMMFAVRNIVITIMGNMKIPIGIVVRTKKISKPTFVVILGTVMI